MIRIFLSISCRDLFFSHLLRIRTFFAIIFIADASLFAYPRALALVALTWQGYTASAQRAQGYESISTAEGLSQGMVFDMLQDKEGFIWVATKTA